METTKISLGKRKYIKMKAGKQAVNQPLKKMKLPPKTVPAIKTALLPRKEAAGQPMLRIQPIKQLEKNEEKLTSLT